MIRLFVGLGNPGAQYQATRHNAGFWWVDALAQQWNIGWQAQSAYHGWVAAQGVGQQRIWLLKPDTFMNHSGQSVAALARFFKIDPTAILVAHDELDLAPGLAKLKRGGGHAGHNGLRDIHAQLGSSDYWRLRLGIGHPGDKSEVVNWVLNNPPAAQRADIDAAIARSVDAAVAMRSGQMNRATAAVHTHPSAKAARTTAPRRTAPGDESGGGSVLGVDGKHSLRQ